MPSDNQPIPVAAPVPVSTVTGSLPSVRPSDTESEQERAIELDAKRRAFEAEKENQRKLLEYQQSEAELDASIAPLRASMARSEAFATMVRERESFNAAIVSINIKRRQVRRRVWMVGGLILALGIALWAIAHTVMGGW